MADNIIDLPKTDEDWREIINKRSCSYLYIRGENIAVSMGSPSSGTIRILDTTNAYKRGKTCTSYTIYSEEYEKRWEILEAFQLSCRAIFDACEKLPFEEDSYEAQSLMGVPVYKSVEKGVSVYSPLHLDRLKPLKEIPKKWMVTHVIRLLANDQFEDLATSSRYTDDYAYDAATNYGEGAYDKHQMIEKLVESPSGWWFNNGEKDGDYLGINCHSFDYKGCTIRLEGKANTEVESPEPNPAAEKSNVVQLRTVLPENIDRTKVAGILMA